MSLTLAGCAIVFFSLLAFWKYNAILFMIAAGVSMMVGLQWYDVYTTDTGLSISLMMIAYCFVCFGFGFACIFKQVDSEDYDG